MVMIQYNDKKNLLALKGHLSLPPLSSKYQVIEGESESFSSIVSYHQGEWKSILLGIRVRRGLGPFPS
jgi:hypothetical protein